MTFVPVTVRGGLPVIADVWFLIDYYGEVDSGVNALYWQQRDGTRGKELSKPLMDKITKESYWDAYITEQANDWLGEHVPTRYSDGTTIGSYSDEYLKLNPRSA